MELLLWRWSTTAQITSELMIAVFFVVMARSVRRVEMRPWIQAWLWNLAALFVTIVFWFAQPKSRIAFMATVFGYTLSKTIFSVLLVAGTWNFVRRPPGSAIRRAVIVIVIAYSIAAAFAFDKIDKLGTAQSAVIGLILGFGALLLLITRTPGAGWLAAGLSIRTMLAIIETLAHGARLFPQHFVSESAIGIFVASYSSFDTGAEWVIALGCVLILYRTIQQELTQSNVDLLAAQEVLQELVDRDPLTGLANRRALPEVLRSVFRTGATILFFDLNDFKNINDRYGHQTGDECLKRFARVLQGSFRPDDHVIRYAGDEFVVIAPSADSEQILARIESVRERLKFERSDGPPIKFSVGHANVPINGDGEAALREADEAMYRQKALSGGRLRTV
jgi:diguanylate cyclase (GGDEF)-like protein